MPPKKKKGGKGKGGGQKKKQKKEKSKESKPKSGEEKQTVQELIMKRNERSWKEDPDRDFKFWKSQPVPGLKDKVESVGPIETKTVDQVRAEPYTIPAAFEWVDLDLTDPKEIEELYELLAQHYVEDDDNTFRFNYSPAFLQWALLVPGYLRHWHVGMRVVKTGALCACITAIPALVSVEKTEVQMVEINFLCVHKKLRDKRLAPVLIREVTRRVNRENVWQAVYTVGKVIPKPVARNRYWHRSLNPKKLVDIEFSSMPRRMTMPRLVKLYRVDKEVSTPGLREMQESDAEATWRLLANFLEQFPLHIKFSLDEFKHVFLPRRDVVYSYVVEDVETKAVTDFVSFYNLPSSVLNHPRHKEMRAAYSYYNVSTRTPWLQLMNDALVLANKHQFDVFNALDVMQNGTFLKQLKFGIGNGHLQYYLYNYRLPELEPREVGVVLL